jgi:hypothetical protein
MSVNITFLGGSGTVTGSKYLVQHEGKACCSIAVCSRATSCCDCATGNHCR